MTLNIYRKTSCLLVFFAIFSLLFFGKPNCIVDDQVQSNLVYSDFENLSASGWVFLPIERASDPSARSAGYQNIDTDHFGNVHVVYQDNTEILGSGTDDDIFYRRWNAVSESWSSVELVSIGCDLGSGDPDICVDTSGNVHIIWVDYSDVYGADGGKNIFYRTWNAESQSWGSIEAITGETNDEAWSIAITSDVSNNIHVVWSEQDSGYGSDWDIFHKRWEVSSSSWVNAEIVSSGSSDASWTPAIATNSSGDVHIVWQETNNIHYKYWDSSLSSWGALEVISIGEDNLDPAIDCDSIGRLHLVWDQGSTKSLNYKCKNLTSGSWSSIEKVNSEYTYGGGDASIEVDISGDVWVAWDQGVGVNLKFDVAYRRKDSTSGSWMPSSYVSLSPDLYVYDPDIAIDNLLNAHFVWKELFGGIDYDVLYRRLIKSPDSPTLNLINPNPSKNGQINLTWSNMPRADTYYIFRNTSEISLIDGLIPIGSSENPGFIDVVIGPETYYYVVVANNEAGNSSISNCESVTVQSLEDPNTPTLNSIVPNPDYDGIICLNWSGDNYTAIFYLFRSNTSCILSTSGLVPFDTSFVSVFNDTLSVNGTYYYAVIAGNAVGNSTLSNCEWVRAIILPEGEDPPDDTPVVFIDGFNTYILLTIVFCLGAIISIRIMRRKSGIQILS